jgi:hypothetical protein
MPHQTVNLPQTPDGSTIFTYENQSRRNNDGTISVRSGGNPPVRYDAPALRGQPSYVVQNFGGNDLTVANVSVADATPILIQDVGPGVPGTYPVQLPIDGTPVSLSPGETVQTRAVPAYMQLVVRNSLGNRCEIVVIGGPPDTQRSNAYDIAVNASSSTGPPTTVPATAPFYATTTNNAYTFPFSWQSSQVFVANVSARTAGPVQVSAVAL